MELAGEILQYELVWMWNGCTENHFDLDNVKNKSNMSTNEKKLNKDYSSLSIFNFKIIWIFKNPI